MNIVNFRTFHDIVSELLTHKAVFFEGDISVENLLANFVEFSKIFFVLFKNLNETLL